MELYDRIKTLVKERNTTIEALCDQLGMSINTYRGTRQRKQYPDFRHLVAMSEALNVSLDYLAYGKDVNHSQEKELIKAEIKQDLKTALEKSDNL